MGDHICVLADEGYRRELEGFLRDESSAQEIALAYLVSKWNVNPWFQRMAHYVFCDPGNGITQRQINNLLYIKAHVEAWRDMRFMEVFANGR